MSRLTPHSFDYCPDDVEPFYTPDRRDDDTLPPPPRTVVRPMSREEMDEAIQRMVGEQQPCALPRRQAG